MTLQLMNNEGNVQNKDDKEPDLTFTFVRNNDHLHQRIISSCGLTLEKFKTISADFIFRVNSIWNNRDL